MTTKNYCVLPFVGATIDNDGSLKPCCKFDTTVDKQYPKYFISDVNNWLKEGSNNVRQGFIDDNISPACQGCFHGADAQLNTQLKDFANSYILKSKNKTMYDPSPKPKWFDIRFGNVCNLKCIMCDSFASSQIAAEYQANQDKFAAIDIHHRLFKDTHWWKDSNNLKNLLDLITSASYINFSGGEPLAIPELEVILEHIPSNCLVSMNTNITLLTDKHIQLFNKLPRMKLQISLDGVGSHQEYIRYGSKWATIQNNIEKLLDSYKRYFDFSFLLQATSIYTFPDFYEYLKQIKKSAMIVTIRYYTLKSNGFLTINSVPPADVEKFKEWHKNNQSHYSKTIDLWLEGYNYSHDAHESFKKYVATLDEIRGCDFKKTFNPSW